MVETKKCEYDNAVKAAGGVIPALFAVSADIKRNAEEVRLRAGQPVVIRCGRQNTVLQTRLTASQLEECVAAFCRHSVHSFEKELAAGYITLSGGHRAGFCGTAVYSGDTVTFIKNISSVNIRIARQHPHCADRLTELFTCGAPPKGLLITGRPLSGKTTVLRDLCRGIGGKYRLAIIDERDEIAAVSDGVSQFDVGLLADVFSGFRKNDGLIRAVRTMSPDYIVLDELGAEYTRVCDCLNSGVGIIMTAHAADMDEAAKNNQISRLLDVGAISHIASLSGRKAGEIESISVL